MTDLHSDSMADELRVVLVTGALGGIGSAVVELYHDQDYYVIGIDRFQKNDGEFLDFKGDEYHQIDLSVTGYMHVEQIFSRFENSSVRWKLVTVIHCAAYQFCAPIMDSSSQELREFDQTMNINVGAVYYLNQALYPFLKRNQGNVVVVGSVHSVASSVGISLYAISKCALTGLVRNTCIEWAKDGIRINMVSPGAIDTPMLRAGLARGGGDVESKFEILSKRHLNGRVGNRHEVAQVIFFLGNSEASGLINGQNIVADGGVSCVLSTEVI